MAKFYGKVGYASTQEERPSIWKNSITEVSYYGDVLTNQYRWENSQGVNDNIKINNRISIIADENAIKNSHNIKWVEWMNIKWKVSSVEIQPPRVILTLGDVYNED